MYLTSFYSNATPAANDNTFTRSPAKMIDDAISAVMNNGSFDYAECSVTDGIWTVSMAPEYLVSKSIGFIDLASQELLRQDLYNIIKMNINC